MTEENKELSLPEGLSKSKEELLEKLRHVQPERREDKPKIRNRCGDCAAFHTHFCPFELTDEKRAPILRNDYACSDFFPRLKLEVWHRQPEFDQVVENL
jgi:hypothetical protein